MIDSSGKARLSKPRYQWFEIKPVARGIAERLGPACQRIEVAGSVRRGEQFVSDIEIVASPRMEPVDQLLELASEMEESGAWTSEPPPPFKQKARGQRYRRYYVEFGKEHLPVDVFIVRRPAQWGVILLIRTGPDSFSKAMVTQQVKGGLLPDDMRVKDGVLCVLRDGRDPQPLETREEEDWFRQAGLPYYLRPGLRFVIDKGKGERYCRKCLGPWRPGKGCWCL